MRRILVTWIGHADLGAMAATESAEKKKQLSEALGTAFRQVTGDGPIKTLLVAEQFDEVHLLSNYPVWIGRLFCKWIAQDPHLHPIDLRDPTDYAEIFKVVDRVLATISVGQEPAELCVHLSPGTPAMTAIWVLLGKSRYPATFFQTHGGRSWKTEIPFDLFVDFLPALLRDPDANLVGLAAQAPKDVTGFESILGSARAIRIAVGRAKRVAIRDVPALITGESGTGKELFARAMHAASPRRAGPFVALNCAAIPRELLESELFGHKKGAYTGATADRAGAFEEANGGTLFLDEVGECPLDMQAKLLRVLQPLSGKPASHRLFRRLGETRERESDVRLISATNQNLPQAIERRDFRSDLYYRLAVVTVPIPPLRERREDIPVLAAGLLQQINASFRLQEPAYTDKSISGGAKAFVAKHFWPGNVRQLFNTLVQAAVMAEGDVIERQDIVDAIGEVSGASSRDQHDRPLGDGFNLIKHLESIQREYLQQAMTEARGVKTHAAKLLGIENYQTLDAQLKRLKVNCRD